MQPITSSLINASRKATKFLQRDFLELEVLQRSSHGNYGFCNKAYMKAKDLLSSDLQKHTNYLFYPEDQFKPEYISDSDIAFLINPIDSLSNLERSIPFFGLSITCLKKVNNLFSPIACVINFPALNQIAYSEKGKGSWLENNLDNSSARLRVSGYDKFDNCIIVTDHTDICERFLKNSRIFGSYCYGIFMLVSGKVDGVHFSSLNYTLELGFELMIQESGGTIIKNGENFSAATSTFAEKFKKHI